jgi:flagellar motility protein MotE (MotC chaperone)
MLKFVALAAVLAISTTSAVAQPPATETAAPTAKAQDPDKKRCERIVEETGSRLGGRRICKTEAEWAAERQQSREESERAAKNARNLSGG